MVSISKNKASTGNLSKKSQSVTPDDFNTADLDLACSASTSATDFSQSFMYSLHQIFFLLEKHIEHTLLVSKSISFSQFMILVGFDCSSNPSMSQKMIAEKLYLTEATVSRHIGSLVTLGYIKQLNDTQNRRKKIITITPLGKKVFAKAKLLINKELDLLFSVINEKDKQDILKNFIRVRKQLLSKK